MRTLGFRTHVLLAIAGAIGVLGSLTRPWYAPGPPATTQDPGIGDIHGPLNAFFDGLGRWVSVADGTSGWQALDHWAQMIAAMVVVAALGALACTLPRLQVLGRDLARYGAFAALACVAWKLVDTPGPNDALELRAGGLLAGVFALVLFTCASGVANAPLRRRVPERAFRSPPRPPVHESAG